MINEKLVEMHLPYLGKKSRTVRVYVPAHEQGELLPVIYMTDGQNLFDEETSTYGCWHTPQTLKAERKLSGKAAIIVGIHNDGSSMERTNELTPKSIGKIDSKKALPLPLRLILRPQGELFDDFVVNTVMPAVEKKFPVMTGRNNTAFCGSSSGGLQSFFTALSHPDKFCAAGVFSPAFLFYGEDDMRRWVMSVMREKMPYLYIYTGAGDKLEKNIFDSVEMTYDILTQCYPLELLSEIVLLENKHHESAWEPVFGDFLHTFLERREEF